MAEWLIEEGLREHRAVLHQNGTIAAVRVDWLDPLRPGRIAIGRIVNKPAGTRRGLAQLDTGEQLWVDGLPPSVTEGMAVPLRIVRAPLAERGRNKLAAARPARADAPDCPGPSLFDSLRATGLPVRRCRAADGTFTALGWDEVVEQASTGTVGFDGGTLLVCPTPGMTVIDIDGAMPPRALALAAVPAIARAVRQLDLAGAIGIDFPSLADRADRQAVDAALADALQGWPGERTATNGFGFVQLVSRMERPSLAALYQRFPARVAVETLVRRAEALRDPGPLLLSAHPDLRPALCTGFDAALQARTGRPHTWHWDEGLALQAPGAGGAAMSRTDRKCPICGRPRHADHAPFCSPRCRDRDLMRWLDDGYALPGPRAAPDLPEDA